jgi:hypothetical protein
MGTLQLGEMMEFSTIYEVYRRKPRMEEIARYYSLDSIIQKCKDNGAEEVQASYAPQENRISSFYGLGAINIVKVPKTILGENVLGQAIPSLGLVQIRDDLYGDSFEEVKHHELNHCNYPNLSEWQIRQKTKNELPFEPRFH